MNRRYGNVYTPEELKVMASVGRTGSILGGRLLAPQANLMIKRADAIHEQESDAEQRDLQRQQTQGYYDQMDRQFGQREAEDKRQFDARMADNATERSLRVQENAADRALSRELKKMGLDMTPDAAVEKLTAAQQKEANEWGALREDVADVKGRVAANPGVATPWKQGVVLGAEMLAPERLEPWARKRAEGVLFDADERQTRQALREQVANRVKALSGAAASDSERAFIMSFMPGENDNLEDLNNSLNRLGSYAEQRSQRGRTPRGSLADDAAQDSRGPVGPRNRKVVGGRTFVQVGPDEWEEQ